LMSENRKVYTLAKVVIRKACSQINQAHVIQVQNPIAENLYGNMLANVCTYFTYPRVTSMFRGEARVNSNEAKKNRK
ncbi:9740_t:CDS:1, partial [Funneliformis geosporum]